MQANSRILLRIQGLMRSFRPAERKVAEFILDHKRDVIHTSITDIAERSGTSEATVIRFCRKLSFNGFQHLKIAIASEIVSPLETIHEAINERDDTLSVAQKVFRANIQAIEDSLRILDPAEMQRAVDALARARRILFLGAGGSGIVAQDAEHKFLKTGIPVVSYTDMFMQTMAAVLVNAGDVVVGISHTGSTRSIVEAIDLARKSGATTICITQSLKSPITRAADICLFVISREVEYRDEGTGARIAQLCMIDSLYVAIAKQRPDRTLDVIQKTRLAIAPYRY